MDLYDIEQLKALLARHGFRFSKSMGQNFLVEPRIPRETAAASGAGPGVGVLEIGPGIGPLTRELSALADKVVCMELDRSLLPILHETLADRSNVEVIPGDILKADIPALVRDRLPGLTPIVCANLPYNITTPVLTALLDAGCFSCITVMLQREAAYRICARAGAADYGVFSIYCQYHAQVQPLFDVGPECFLPPPKVTSCVLRLTPRPAPALVDDPEHFFRVVRAAFTQRRKTLLNNLSSVFGAQFRKDILLSCILSCNLPENIRAEQLSISDFAQLSAKLRQINGG